MPSILPAKRMIKLRSRYFAAFLLTAGIEVLIALYVHDSIIRPYVGDMLVVIVLYCFAQAVLPERVKLLPVWIFLLAAAVEVLQYFRLVELLGLQASPFWRVLLGTTFDGKDIACYAAGCLLLGIYEHKLVQPHKKG